MRILWKVDKDIGQFHIPMHHLVLIDLLEPLNQLLKDNPRLELREAPPSHLFQLL
jgi:hypothetical protein